MSKVGPRPEEEERVPTDKKHVYDYVDAKIWVIFLIIAK
jgi:lipopolysaccharide/colanic/teichoic acid biosynthesis glycosyltransferase